MHPVLAAAGHQGDADHLVLTKVATDGLIKVCGLTLQLTLIYVPFFNTVFRTTPLRPPVELGVCAVGALVIILITESRKLFLRRKQH